MPSRVYVRAGMQLLEIYKCLCDETRLRVLNLLTEGPLCVCHFQSILKLPQVAVSKHLAYLRKRDMVSAKRHGQWMVYQLAAQRSRELHLQLQCLQDCVQSHPIFREDLKRLRKLGCACEGLAKSKRKKGTNREVVRI